MTHCAGAPKSLDVDSDEPLNGAVRKPVKKEPGKSEILLDGRIYKVRWGDGDTFRLKTLTGKKKKSARLAGFNTLESYGPVHRWGEWTADELYQLANTAGVVAAAQGWTCSKQPGGGGYGRLLVACPELERVLLEKGLAHIFSIDGPGDPELVALQRKAQEERVGMWEKGVPQGVDQPSQRQRTLGPQASVRPRRERIHRRGADDQAHRELRGLSGGLPPRQLHALRPLPTSIRR